VLRNFISLLRQQGWTAALKLFFDRCYVRWFEWRLGIRSESRVELKELGAENELHRPYVPTDYRSFQKVLRSLDIRPGEGVFLDFGSGLGRAVVMAAKWPFRKVIGVEIAHQLNEVARENIRSALPRLKCRDIEIITAEATQFAIPTDVTLIYFFNPFCGDVLARVLSNILESHRHQPRAIELICKIPAQSGFEEEIRQHAWLVEKRQMVFDADCRYVFFAVNPWSK
jgi:SAM-dependent methyltransferase